MKVMLIGPVKSSDKLTESAARLNKLWAYWTDLFFFDAALQIKQALSGIDFLCNSTERSH
jgi:hypothetical protein